MREFYTPTEVKPDYPEIIKAYQIAFADNPWNEVSKCVDLMQGCPGGLSPTNVGSICLSCCRVPTEVAYPAGELVDRFDMIGKTYPTVWYIEREEAGISLAALGWKANSDEIARSKYDDVPVMKDWMRETLGDSPVLWLDEIFANKQIKPSGNLRNFRALVNGMARRLEVDTVAYRTKEVKMTLGSAERDFGNQAQIFDRLGEQSDWNVPDRRDFVRINLRAIE